MRFGRKKDAGESGEDSALAPAPKQAPTPSFDEAPADGAPARARELPDSGPFDASEVDLDDGEWVDLGSLLLPPPQGEGAPELRLQVDEQSGNVMAVLLVGQQGALELRAFAASRGGGAWDELRPRIAEETERLGGKTKEEEGTFGTELLCLVPVKDSAGETATQASRFAGHEGPTWMLRTNILGQAAVEAELGEAWEQVVRTVVVRRGAGAMAPGTALPLTLPPEARKVEDGE